MDHQSATDARKNFTSKKSFSSSSSSFRLRCESLNSLRLRRVFDLFDKNGDGLITVDEIKQALLLLGLENDEDDDDRNNNDELNSIVTSFVKPGNQGLTFEDFQALHESLSNTFFFDCSDNHDEGDDGEEQQQQQQQQEEQVESDLNEAFKVFDSDGDGYISAMELQQVLSKLGFPEAQQELHQIQHMISSFDKNRDGRVDFFEFKHMMSRTLLVPC